MICWQSRRKTTTTTKISDKLEEKQQQQKFPNSHPVKMDLNRIKYDENYWEWSN